MRRERYRLISRSGSLAMFTAMRRDSSWVISLAAAPGESCAAFPRACGAVDVTEQPGDLWQTDLASPASALITGPPITQTVMAARLL